MGFVRNWLQKITGSKKAAQAEPSSEWQALSTAISQRDFSEISPSLRAWCSLPERKFTDLVVAARQADFSEFDINKLEVLFEYYCDNQTVAFAKAQEHNKKFGFDLDLYAVCLVSLYQNNQFEDANTFLQQLSDQQMQAIDRADFWQMVGVIRWANNDMSTLEEAADRVVALAPNESAVLQTALAMYIELGCADKIAAVRAKIEASSNNPGYAYSLCLLAMGEHEIGWKAMEARYDMEEAHRYINQGLRKLPRWQGEALTGRSLLVSAEQGLGDTIQMARYLSRLQTMGASSLGLETQPEALTLLQYNFPELQIVERQWATAPALKFDLWIGMMSLPLFLNEQVSCPPGRCGYLRTPPDNLHYWRERLAALIPSGKPRIGLAWSGQPTHRADRRRSVPFQTMMQRVRQVDASFVALQMSIPPAAPANLINLTEEIITLADTAALIELMDLVITVDTSVVHLAGALHKEAWLLLPKRYEWRWRMEGEDNDWYDSVKVLRQTEHAQWEPLLDEVFLRRLRQRFNI